MDFELDDIYEELIKTLPGATDPAWNERDALMEQLKSRTWWRRKAALENEGAKLHHILRGIKDKDYRVAAAAKSPLLTPDMLGVVMQHPDERVRKEALINPRIPLDLIDKELASPDM